MFSLAAKDKLGSNKNANIKLIICLALIITTIAVYWNLQHHEFVHMDDNAYVFANMNVQTGLNPASVKWAFTSIEAAFWHPLTWLSLMLDYELYGLNAGGYHWTNLLLHTISTVLLFLVLNLMTGSLWRSGFVAALFALHPLHIESVAWVAQRKDVLSTVFWMLTMYAYLIYVRRPGFWRYFIVMVVFVLGSMAKPMLVTLPFVLLLLDYWPLRRFTFAPVPQVQEIDAYQEKAKSGQGGTILLLVVEKVPLIALSIAFSVIVLITENKGAAIASFHELSFFARLGNALVSYLTYLYKMIIPINLAVFYPHPLTWPGWQVLSCFLVLSSITAIVVFYLKRFPYLAVGWFWYLGTLVPVIGLVQVGSHAMADRYTYIPLIGLFVILAWGFFDLALKWKKGRVIFSSFACLILCALAAASVFQLRHWENSLTLFKHALAATKGNYLAHSSIGAALLSKNKIDEAITHYLAAVKLRRDYALAYFGLGYSYYLKENYPQALFNYTQALKIDPDYFNVHYQLSHLLLKMNRLNEAIEHCRRAIALKPDFSASYTVLGNIYLHQRNYEQAIQEYRRSLKLLPEQAGVHHNLALALLHQNKIAEAAIHFEQALQLEPQYANAHFYLAKILNSQGRKKDALYHHLQAIKINPVYQEKNLGDVLRED